MARLRIQWSCSVEPLLIIFSAVPRICATASAVTDKNIQRFFSAKSWKNKNSPTTFSLVTMDCGGCVVAWHSYRPASSGVTRWIRKDQANYWNQQTFVFIFHSRDSCFLGQLEFYRAFFLLFIEGLSFSTCITICLDFSNSTKKSAQNSNCPCNQNCEVLSNLI